MKILELNAYYNYGSTGHIVRDLCAEGQKLGHDMYAIYWLLCDEKLNSDKIIFCGDEKEPSTFVKICQWIFDGGKLNYNLERTNRIVRQIKIIKPDIIHLHNLHGDFEYGSIDLKLLFEAIADTGSKVIWTLHDCWPITGRCYHFSYKHCEKWLNGCGKCPQRFFDREGILFDYSKKNWREKSNIYKMIDDLTIVTVSNWLKSVVQKSILKDHRIITIYNGIDTDVFKPKKTSREQNKTRILCIGWDRRKGYKDYYRLATLLSEEDEIIVVGRRPFFRRFHSIPNNIKEVDRVTSKEKMAKIYRSCDVYFNASPAETFGLTTAEALACGTPVIGYKNTATTEIIEAIGEGSYLVADGAVDEVKEKLDILKKSSINKEKMHKKCRELFRHSYMLDSYMNLYTEIATREDR